jgi:hypothetical protein
MARTRLRVVSRTAEAKGLDDSAPRKTDVKIGLLVRAGLLATVAIAHLWDALPAGTHQAPLITEEEALLPPPDETRAPPDLPRNGPVIRVVSPTEPVVTRPFDVDLRFEPRHGGPPVQMASLKVALLKLIEIDLTDRVRPYVRETRLFVPQAPIPSGRHRLKISIADEEGGVTADILQVTVR